MVQDGFQREHRRQYTPLFNVQGSADYSRKLQRLEFETKALRKHIPSKLAQPLTSGEANEAESEVSASFYDHGLEASDPEALQHFSSIDTWEPTLSQTLRGEVLEAADIDSIFEIFFRDFAPFMPILDPSTPPNAYYSSSKFLFWAIIGAACRTYPKKLPILDVLRPSIFDMALSSLKSKATLQSIQAFLLLLCWPFAKTHKFLDRSFLFAGALLHAAMEVGIHTPSSSHEVSSATRLELSPAEARNCAEIWAWCIIIYQRCYTLVYSAERLLNHLLFLGHVFSRATLQRCYLISAPNQTSEP